MLVAMVGMYSAAGTTDIPSLMGFPFGTDDFPIRYTDRWRHAAAMAGVLCILRGENADVACPHGCLTRTFRPHGGFCGACVDPVEDGRLRLLALLAVFPVGSDNGAAGALDVCDSNRLHLPLWRWCKRTKLIAYSSVALWVL
jgi:hypothetical protein